MVKLAKMETLVVNTNQNADHIRISSELYDDLSELDDVFLQKTINWKKIAVHKTIILPSPSPKNILILLLCLILNKKIFIGIHDVEGHEQKDKKKVQIYNNVVTKLATGVIVYSEFSRRQLQNHFPLNGSIFTYYFVAAELTQSPSVKESADYKADILYFGRANEYSGRDNLEHIVKLLREKKFLLMGAGLPERLAQYENVTLLNRRFTDFELHQALSYGPTVIFPYNSATQSGGIPLAISYCCNIVFFDVGGLRDQLRNYPSTSVPPTDLEAFCRALQLINSKVDSRDRDKWVDEIKSENRRNLVELIGGN